jgi:hypothetical protein
LDSMEPTDAEVVQFGMSTSVDGIFKWLQIPDAVAKAIGDHLGLAADLKTVHPRVLAVMPVADFRAALEGLTIDDNPAKPAILNLATLAHRAARKVLGVVEAPAPTPAAPAAGEDIVAAIGRLQSGSSSRVERKVKMANILDPNDDAEIPSLTAAEEKQFFDNYFDIKQGEPEIESEPTADQISAMNTRITKLKLEPYADFSILTPFGRRMAKHLRHRSWLLQQDGTYQPCEVPGPADWDTWYACWRVYATILLMLRWPAKKEGDKEELVVSPAALECYLEAFRTLVREHPEAWHLCCKAEDRSRAEHLGRTKRRLERDREREATWSEVFVEVARDDRYWDKEVRRPALAFLARGSRGSPAAPYDDDPAGLKRRASQGDKQQKSQAKKTKGAKRAEKAARYAAAATGQDPPDAGGAHPRKQADGRFSTTREGKEVCYTFQKGREACPEPCPNGRAHVCQLCLMPHRTSECPKGAGGGGGGKGRGKGARS